MAYTLTLLCAFYIFAALQVPCGAFSGLFGGNRKSSSSSPVGAEADADEIVNKHNALRRSIQPTASNMLKMSWSSEAAASAQRWADTCSMKHSHKSSRRISTGFCGENLYMSNGKDSWSHAVQDWYNEIHNWRYGEGSVNGGAVGHFTEVVWYRSNHVGCALVFCPKAQYKYFYVCQYCPAGNSQLARPYKAGPPCGDCPNSCEDKLCTNPCPYTNKYSNCPKLTEQWGCSNADVASWCPASCKCTTQII